MARPSTDASKWIRPTSEDTKILRRNGSTDSANKLPDIGQPCLMSDDLAISPTISPPINNKLLKAVRKSKNMAAAERCRHPLKEIMAASRSQRLSPKDLPTTNTRCCDMTMVAAKATSLSLTASANKIGSVLVSVRRRSPTTFVEKISARPTGIYFGMNVMVEKLKSGGSESDTAMTPSKTRSNNGATTP